MHDYFFSPDSRLLAVNFGGKTVMEGVVWHLARGAEIRKQAGGVVCFSPGNRQVVTGVFGQGEVRLFELHSGKEQTGSPSARVGTLLRFIRTGGGYPATWAMVPPSMVPAQRDRADPGRLDQ